MSSEVELRGEVLVAARLDGVAAEGEGASVVAEQRGRREGEVVPWQEAAEQAARVDDLSAGLEEGHCLGVAGGGVAGTR